MNSRLLETKFHMPPWRMDGVPRPRLIERLNAGLRERHRLTLISAPAGYGKTTLVVEWLTERMRDEGRRMKPSSAVDAHPSSFIPHPSSFVWLSLDPGDNDPVRFLGYLIAALQRIDPALGQHAQSLLTMTRLPPLQLIVEELINDLASLSASIILVLDDYHVITNTRLHEALDYFVSHQPAPLHLVITSRENPPLPLARLRARGQLTELRAHDLRFTLDEARHFFQHSMRLDLDAAIVAALETRTEGWAAGLQLAGLAMQHLPDQHEFITTFTGSHRYIIDYLLDEVLRQQTPELRAFLGRTAVLSRFNADLCQAVTGNPDAAAILDQLECSNLFVIALDDQRGWYRYHQLFADVLRATLSPEVERESRVVAACWLESQGLLAEAIPLWLDVPDAPAAARLVNTLAVDLLSSGELQTVLGWVDALPAQLVKANSDLVAYKAFALMMTGRIPQAYECIAQAAEVADDQSVGGQGRLLTIQAFLALSSGEDRTGDLARAALVQLDESDRFFRSIALSALGYAYAARGNLTDARGVFREAYLLGKQLQHPFIALSALANLAANLLDQGQLREAEALCRAAMADYVDRRGQPLPILGIVAIRLASICYEKGDFAEAYTLVIQGIDWCKRVFSYDIMGGDSEAVLARIAFQQGHPARAFELLQTTAQAARQHKLMTVLYKMAVIQAELHLLQGNLAEAEMSLSELDALSELKLPRSEQLIPHIRARYLIGIGQPEQALVILEQLAQAARASTSPRLLMHIALSQALAYQQQCEMDRAISAFAAALRPAIQEGYRGIFIPHPGLPTRPLLLASRALAPAFVNSILSVSSPIESDTTQPLSFLSEQELRVLALIVAGKSNQEIADALVIGVGTAKWHVHNILQKLGVSNRPQAIARARALGM